MWYLNIYSIGGLFYSETAVANEGLGFTRYSINICWGNELMNERMNIYSPTVGLEVYVRYLKRNESWSGKKVD